MSSSGAIIQGNDDLCRQILEVVATTDDHIPPNKLGSIVDLLWNVTGTGPFNGRFAKLARNRTIRNMKDCVSVIINHYSHYTTLYVTTLQTMEKLLQDEMSDAQLEVRKGGTWISGSGQHARMQTITARIFRYVATMTWCRHTYRLERW